MTKFEHPHVILPVIHVEHPAEMLTNATLARSCGCDGVFLIAHVGNYFQLEKFYNLLRKELPDWWIGINALDLHPTVTFDKIEHGLFPGVNGVWDDNAEIFHNQDASDQPLAKKIWEGKSVLDLLYFGGVAFKYVHPLLANPQTDEARIAVVDAARAAKDYMDVVVTSGPGTGHAADVSKIESMASACTPTPLGIASGLTLDNVHNYLPYAKFLLVATGISDTWTKFNPDLLQAFVDKVRVWGG